MSERGCCEVCDGCKPWRAVNFSSPVPYHLCHPGMHFLCLYTCVVFFDKTVQAADDSIHESEEVAGELSCRAQSHWEGQPFGGHVHS